LNVHVPREACPFNLAPTTSTTAMLVLGDALALALLDARGLKRSDFARYHPAGAIGRALLLKVSDIMRTGERHPVATESTTVRDGLFLMTRAKAGCLTIINRQGKLAGVFTDGDLRRHMAENPAVLERPLREVMTPRPVCIREDALAAEALKIFNERRIDDLVVVNAHRKPVGLVDSQDLPRMKLM
jgi:arabinose-5-phosphate isomerase